MSETEFGFVLGVLSTFEKDIHTDEIIGYVVVISVPGVIIGLIYMNSKTMQNYYAKLRGFDKKKQSRKKS